MLKPLPFIETAALMDGVTQQISQSFAIAISWRAAGEGDIFAHAVAEIGLLGCGLISMFGSGIAWSPLCRT